MDREIETDGLNKDSMKKEVDVHLPFLGGIKKYWQTFDKLSEKKLCTVQVDSAL